MKAGKGWSAGQGAQERRSAGALLRSCAPALLLLLAGCASTPGKLDKKLMADKSSAPRAQGVGAAYLVGFPDVLEIQANGHPEISHPCVIAPDGRINLGQGDRLRVEGKSLAEVAGAISVSTGVSAATIQVRVKEYRSEPIFLIGQVVGWQRAVPYHGPETVLEVLQRVGGITPGAAPDEIFVVRAHVADGPRPEVFHVDLNAILRDKDQKTNIRVLPFDQVYVGESKKAKLLKCIPPCLRPVFFPLLGIRPIGPEGNGIRNRGPGQPESIVKGEK